jgi:serine/threonine protein kinase
MQPLPTVPGYELYVRLGGGPLTEVYAARDLGTDSPCAVKLLRPQIHDEPTAIKLLQREARACLAVRHPHLVRLLYTHVTRPPYFLVMELLDGESLRQRLRRDYRLAYETSVWIARQTAEAIDALHRAGFAHGDVKPDNMRLVSDGQAVLLDLGFAHRPGENSALLNQGYVLGTANYLAPELCGPDPVDGLASDLFSLGVMCFEMLTGLLPYPPGPARETMRRHLLEQPADIRASAENVPQALARLLERLLARHPDERLSAALAVQHFIALEIATIGRRRRSA